MGKGENVLVSLWIGEERESKVTEVSKEKR